MSTSNRKQKLHPILSMADVLENATTVGLLRKHVAHLRGSPPPLLRKSIFLKKFDFEISTCTESPKCPLSDYVRFIAL
jgi:hypothetical protein